MGQDGDIISEGKSDEYKSQTSTNGVVQSNEESSLIKKQPVTPVIVPAKVNIEKPIKHEAKKSADDKDWELVPPDGGWGWLILAGSMLVNLLVPGTVKSFGVLFVEFVEAFDASPATAAWIPALCYFLYSSLGPLSSILSVKYSYRTVTLIGGTFASVGMMISYYASSVNFLYISYGVLVGTGAGLSFPPTVYIVTSYFVRLRGLANGICISGSAFGSIILPPLLRYLLEKFGYRGAVLIMGAITLNTWVAALFYEPVENHMKKVKKVVEPDYNTDDYNDIIEEAEEDEGITLEFTKQGDDSNPKFIVTSEEALAETPKVEISSPENFKYSKNGDSFARSASAVAVQNLSRSHNDDSHSHRYRKISTPVKATNRNDSFINQLSSTPSLYAVPENRFSHSSRLSRLNQYRSPSGRPPKRSPSTSSFQYVSTPYHGSTLSIQPQEFASHLSLKSIASSINPVASCSKSKEKKGFSKFLDLTLLRDPIYLVILISNSTNAIGYTNFIILLPAYAGTLGFDKNLAAYLLSIVSALDLIGRIGGSALSDIELIPKTWYYVGGLALSGASLAVLPFASSYSMVSFWCALFGLASGTYVGVTAVIMADMLGTERLTSSYGISLFVNGILQLIGPPICGHWFESIGTYGPVFNALGLTLLAGSSLWGLMPFINRKRRAQAEALRKQEENDKEFLP